MVHPTGHQSKVMVMYVEEESDFYSYCRFLRNEMIVEEHSERYIWWHKEANSVILDKDAYHRVLSEIRAKYEPLNTNQFTKTEREGFKDGTYCEYVPKKYRSKEYRIYLYADGKYTIYRCRRDGRINFNQGKIAKDNVVDMFSQRTGLGSKAMYNAFGVAPMEWKVCTPKAMYYINYDYVSDSAEDLKIITHSSSVDGCSQYPTALCGDLPTTRGFKQVEGTVKPTEEYPFALYLKTGHVAVYNEFDTHDWLYHRLAWILFRNEDDVKRNPDYPYTYKYLLQFNPDCDITILMKKSKYSLKEEMEYYFSVKENAPKDSEERKEAKLVMNAFIGMFHQSTERTYNSFPYCHLSNIAIARANARLLAMSDKIEDIEDILHICVDSITYRYGTKLGVEERKLGNFEQEFYDCDMVMGGINNYIVKNKDGNVIKYKHGAYDIYKNGYSIEKNPPTRFEQMFDYAKTDNRSEWDFMEEYKNKEI